MPGTRQKNPGFTLIELILVMVIIAIAAGIVAPALATFTAGRAIDNSSRQILALAQYAHTQSISQARTYRLNFDESSGQFWLTSDSGAGTFAALKGDFSTRFTVNSGLRVKVDVTPQPNINLLVLPNVQQQQIPQTGMALNGQQSGAAGSIMQNLHSQGTYIEFQSTGRIDPATITLTDSTHHTKQIVCATPTELFQIVEGAQR